MDERYKLAKERLTTLSTEELKRIIDNVDLILFDTYNYNQGKFCPIAIAMNLHETIESPTDKNITDAISQRFKPVNIFKGAEGNFYTENRKEDLISLCNEILTERNKK